MGLGITEYVQQLIDNQAEEFKWNNKMLSLMEFDEWKEVLLKRSQAIRGFFAQNEECIGKIREQINGDITAELAAELYSAARTMTMNGRYDPILIAEICGPAVDFFIKNSDVKENEEKAISAIAIRNTSLMDSYMRMDPGFNLEKLQETYSWAITRDSKYTEYESASARLNIINAYANLMIFLTQNESEEDDILAFEYLDRLTALMERPEIQAIEQDKVYSSAMVSDANVFVPLEVDFKKHSNKLIYEKIVEKYDYICELKKDSDDPADVYMIKMLNIRQRQHRGEIDLTGALIELEELAQSIPDTNWVDDGDKSQSIFLLFGYLYTFCMQNLAGTDFEPKQKEDHVFNLIHKFRAIVEGMPFEFLNAYVNDVFSGILAQSLPNMYDIEHIEELINELLMRRQPSTYLHTKMVEKISLLIADEILDKKPELFATVPGFEDIAADKAKGSLLKSYISRAACLHDIGKCHISTVINQQSRKLIDDEFGFIKAHPLWADKYFSEKSEFNLYRDVIKGHHKTYDGKGGYPYSFDNTASPYRIIIDLISISDSADAATDITGRNFTKGKNFKSLLGELVESAGVRYNPDIVKIIADSPELIEKLTKITDEDRIRHSYEAYRHCLAGDWYRL